jgi:hypothetical protein
MKDVARAMRWAEEVWRADPPSDAEIRAGADRIARRLEGSRSAWTAGRTWTMSVAAAALLGAIGYAGRTAWHEPARSATGRDSAPDKEQITLAPNEGARPAPPDFRIDEVPRSPAGGGVGTDPPRSIGATPPGPDALPKLAPPRASTEPTWIDVSEALAVPDRARAERLLVELASRGHDANTRAKAHLGLAQLDEARNDCESAKQHALRAAALPDVEIKTVRRALELAARCAR